MIHYNTDKDLFLVFEVKMLVRIRGSNVAPGGKAYASKIPNGQVYLSKEGTGGTKIIGQVFETNAIEGTHFERL